MFQPTPPSNQGQLPVPVVVLPSSLPPFQPAAAPSSANLAGCGISAATSNRVVGGLPAGKGKPSPSSNPLPSPNPLLAAGAYPWIAALGYYDEPNRNALKFLCAGSLISAHYVITSAHCITPTLTLVRLGEHDLSKSMESGARDFRIRRSIVNEHFDLASIANDIALIELNGEAPSNGEWRHYEVRISNWSRMGFVVIFRCLLHSSHFYLLYLFDFRNVDRELSIAPSLSPLFLSS